MNSTVCGNRWLRIRLILLIPGLVGEWQTFETSLLAKDENPANKGWRDFWWTQFVTARFNEVKDRLHPEEELILLTVMMATIATNVLQGKSWWRIGGIYLFRSFCLKAAQLYLRMGKPDYAFQTIHSYIKFPSPERPCHSVRQARKVVKDFLLSIEDQFKRNVSKDHFLCLWAFAQSLKCETLVILVKTLNRVDYGQIRCDDYYSQWIFPEYRPARHVGRLILEAWIGVPEKEEQASSFYKTREFVNHIIQALGITEIIQKWGGWHGLYDPASVKKNQKANPGIQRR